MNRHYTEAEIEAAIEEMMGMPHYIEKFIFDGVDTDGLVRLALGRGIPLRDGSYSDGRLLCAWDDQITLLRDEFTTWAKGGKIANRPSSRSHVEKYLDYLMEHAA